MDTGISSDVSKFADDTKIGRVIQSGRDASALQGDLDKLFDWAGKWQMEFNVGKCSILSVGIYNPLHNYSSNDTPLSRFGRERDLGVLVNADLRPKAQCIQAKNQAEYWVSSLGA